MYVDQLIFLQVVIAVTAIASITLGLLILLRFYLFEPRIRRERIEMPEVDKEKPTTHLHVVQHREKLSEVPRSISEEHRVIEVYPVSAIERSISMHEPQQETIVSGFQGYKRCPRCGTLNPVNARYCKHCGLKLS